MKILLSLLLALSLGSIPLVAHEAEKLRDLAKVFPTEKLVSETKVEGIEVYSYATDFGFAELKGIFLKYLGKGWTEMKLDAELDQAIKKSMKKQGMMMEGNSLFTNPAFPGVQIGLTQMEMALDGKKFFANITVIRDQEEAGPKKTKPGRKSGKKKKEKPSETSISWKKWSPKAVKKELKKGIPVLVKFHADWCLTSKVNEVRCFENKEVIAFLKGKKIGLYEADLTQKNPSIKKALKKLNRDSVPAYVLHVPGQEEVVLLPETLDPKTLVGTIEEAFVDQKKRHLRKGGSTPSLDE